MDKTNTANTNKWLYAFVGLAVLLNFSGLFVPIIAPDGALYAGIAKSMVMRNNYIDLFAEGRDWLDKPHFPFWMAALSFKCFGFTTWAYKLPAILFLMMGARYTYLLAQNLYNSEVALWAVLILLTAQHIVISNQDVRAEPYLTGLIIASVYHFYKANINNGLLHLVIGALFAACALMTKGMFALIPICGAIAGELIIKQQWKQLFSWKWLLAAALILIFILPELYCLREQFDLHPEKVVFGHHNVSGIRFFFWDSQFGRFFNTGPIKGHGDITFFIHTTLWAFLPWSLLLFAAVFQFFKRNAKNVQGAEWYCISGFLLTFLVFSASKFQLPFYTNIIFPFYAIITAQYLLGVVQASSIKAIKVVQTVIVALLLALVVVLQYFFRSNFVNWLVGFVLLGLVVLLIVLPMRLTLLGYQKVAICTLLAAFIVNLYLNLVFYPALLKYQSGSEAAVWINQNNPEKLPVVQCIHVNDYGYPLEFYLNQPLYTVDENGTGTLPAKPFLMYAYPNNIAFLKTKGWQISPVKTFERYWITRLKPAFLNAKTRQSTLEQVDLVLVK
ncbi:4-amino-4-deoxy-L-arabinose transferase-like glycosyltransferase [Mucilaginibacter gracilis]|uniref:4-amino-4-deoxy-L-arabinose transferase-like glycosyltransferase n=1 Tax=Mucilaginibacter gracilis TaxID=423350 RepID=A0A495IZ10_9SPHI|nr:glycosyltransferase family 39 protein [Mucilaginibacter gracilis]RKR81743.1 4-amino-4-deoxy-L-arabinose transferase-like glycosyltransferase [Mucilaginibacter gracilis]